jgi:hypothetical protein
LHCNAQELDAIAHIGCCFDVSLGNRLNAFYVDLTEGHPRAECQTRQDREFVRSVEATHIETWISLCITARLRFLQHIVERAGLFRHCREDVVASAVEYAVDAAHLVGDQRLTQRLDDGDATGNGRLKIQGNTLLLCKLSQRYTVLS